MKPKYPDPKWEPEFDLCDARFSTKILFLAFAAIAGAGIIVALLIAFVMTLIGKP